MKSKWQREVICTLVNDGCVIEKLPGGDWFVHLIGKVDVYPDAVELGGSTIAALRVAWYADKLVALHPIMATPLTLQADGTYAMIPYVRATEIEQGDKLFLEMLGKLLLNKEKQDDNN